MPIRIRPATPPDAASLATVEIAAWRAAYQGLMPPGFLAGLSHAAKTGGWRQSLSKHGASGRKRVLVAVSDTTVIGFVRVGCEGDQTDVGLVYLLYVLPEHWGHGVGTALMGAGLDELRDPSTGSGQALGAREALLWVLRDNQRARAFYERLGWRPDGRATTDNYGGIELEALCYRRSIQATVP